MGGRYYYLDSDGVSVRGPFGAAALRVEWTRLNLPNATLCCREGTENWQPLGTFVDELYNAQNPSREIHRRSQGDSSTLISVTGKPLSKPAQIATWSAVGCVGAFVLILLLGSLVGVAHPEFQASTDDGYRRGEIAGRYWAKKGHRIPSTDELDSSTRRAAEEIHPQSESGWINGYKSGFEVGYKEASKPAF